MYLNIFLPQMYDFNTFYHDNYYYYYALFIMCLFNSWRLPYYRLLNYCDNVTDKNNFTTTTTSEQRSIFIPFVSCKYWLDKMANWNTLIPSQFKPSGFISALRTFLGGVSIGTALINAKFQTITYLPKDYFRFKQNFS